MPIPSRNIVLRGYEWLRHLVLDNDPRSWSEPIYTGETSPPGRYAVQITHTAPDGEVRVQQWHNIHVGVNDLCHTGIDYEWPPDDPFTVKARITAQPTQVLRLLLTGEILPNDDGETGRLTVSPVPHDHKGPDWQCEGCKPLVDVLRKRMLWASMHWGNLHDDAWPSLARAIHEAGYRKVAESPADVPAVPGDVACESCEQPVYGSPAPDCLAPQAHMGEVQEPPC